MTRSSISASRPHIGLRRLVDIALPLMLAVGIVAVLALTRWDVKPNTPDPLENRMVRTMPSLNRHDVDDYLSDIGKFFDDNFGLRQWAVRVRTRIWLALLRLDPAPDPAFSSQVMPGQKDWLFFSGNKVLPDELRADSPTKATLQSWESGIAQRRAWLSSRGIKYVFVVAPDKRTIYPGNLPAFLAAGRPGLDRRQQIDSALAGSPAWLDLTAALRAEKPAGQLYYRWDTHWNEDGAYLGYRAVMQHLGLSAEPKQSVHWTSVAKEGDLGRMIGLDLTEPDRVPVSSCARAPGPEEAKAVAAFRQVKALYAEPPTECPGASGRLLMIHDSFGHMWEPYLSTQFGFAAYLWAVPTFAEFKQAVEAVHPSVVIEERVERFLILPMW